MLNSVTLFYTLWCMYTAKINLSKFNSIYKSSNVTRTIQSWGNTSWGTVWWLLLHNILRIVSKEREKEEVQNGRGSFIELDDEYGIKTFPSKDVGLVSTRRCRATDICLLSCEYLLCTRCNLQQSRTFLIWVILRKTMCNKY